MTSDKKPQSIDKFLVLEGTFELALKHSVMRHVNQQSGAIKINYDKFKLFTAQLKYKYDN